MTKKTNDDLEQHVFEIAENTATIADELDRVVEALYAVDNTLDRLTRAIERLNR